MLQDQSRNRTPMPDAQPPGGATTVEPEPTQSEAGIARMLAGPAFSTAHPDEALVALGRRFDELHTVWLDAVEAYREPAARYAAFIEQAKARGRVKDQDAQAAWALPGVQATYDREFDTFGDLDPLFKAIAAMPARTIDGLAVKARMIACANWAAGNYWSDRVLGSDEDWPHDLIRNLIDSCLALAGVDWRGNVVAHPAAAATRHGESDRATSAAAISTAIIASWRELAAYTEVTRDENDAFLLALLKRRSALLDVAEALPATPENVSVKALAFAWLELDQIWEDGREHADYATDGRLALDIDTAICGRLKTRRPGATA